MEHYCMRVLTCLGRDGRPKLLVEFNNDAETDQYVLLALNLQENRIHVHILTIVLNVARRVHHHAISNGTVICKNCDASRSWPLLSCCARKGGRPYLEEAEHDGQDVLGVWSEVLISRDAVNDLQH